MKMRSLNRLYCLSLVVTIVTSSGCPSLSSLPLLGADNKTFIGAVCYPGEKARSILLKEMFDC